MPRTSFSCQKSASRHSGLKIVVSKRGNFGTKCLSKSRWWFATFLPAELNDRNTAVATSFLRNREEVIVYGRKTAGLAGWRDVGHAYDPPERGRLVQYDGLRHRAPVVAGRPRSGRLDGGSPAESPGPGHLS